MFPPRAQQNLSRNQPRTASSKPTKNLSKPRCEAWVPLNGWEQSDDEESDIFYLAIDAWAKRNLKIKADAPKGVPSSKIWEPFLCTTDQQCSGILDFEAFVNVSLGLHEDIEVEKEDCLQDEKTYVSKDEKTNVNKDEKTNVSKDEKTNVSKDKKTNVSKDEKTNVSKDLTNGSSQTSKADENKDARIGNKIDRVKIQAEQPKENCQSNKKGGDHVDQKGNYNSDKNGRDHLDKKVMFYKKKNDNSDKKEGVHLNTPTLILPDDDEVQQKDNGCSGNRYIVTHGPRAVESVDGDAINSEDILDGNARNGTAHSAPVARMHQREPLKKRVGSAKTKSAEDRLLRAALKNATKPKVNSKKVPLPANPVKISYAHSGNPHAGIFACEPPMGETLDSAETGDSERTPSESTTSETVKMTSVDHRLLIEEAIKESKKMEYMSKTAIVSIGDLLSTAPRLERRQGQHSNGRESMYAAIANEDDDTCSRESFGTWSSFPRQSEHIRSPSSSSLPPVPVTNRNPSPARDVHSSNSEGRKSGPRQAVNLNSAKIPVLSYRKGARRDSEENGEGVDTKQDKTTDLDDMRHIKYTERIMSALQETTVELDKGYTNRLLKSALARGQSRVHSAGYVRQVPQINDSTTHPAAKSGGKRDHQTAKRGPPAFRPQSFKTPLQRAVENAHKKMYGQHYYLFNNSGATGTDNTEDMRSGGDSAKGHRAHSANGETTNAYAWKENIESQQRHRRKAYSGSEKSRANTTNGHHAGYKVSDFKPNFKTDSLKTERRKTIQR
ncbi:uncharacterized protein LOC100890864 isoform X3 [Strongylocentrotus purpuratus]|uniref:Uncharacterized protein n=1 Tax=Strongylocentrotus purpuratus TaxID=7668 RepID=A0A7M7PLY7_STRPU|nr:uncharacterized protein LOC100890864 isoform X3 [Strongylocentrotus purpuratus]